VKQRGWILLAELILNDQRFELKVKPEVTKKLLLRIKG